jgi:hypothetical protein
MRRLIITGAPGAGKTAIIRKLELDGFSVVEEAATDVIAVAQAEGTIEPCALVNQGEYQFFKGIAVSRGGDRLLFEIQSSMVPLFTFRDITLYGNATAKSPPSKRP